ncbi:hypothetical protein ACIBCA_02960 [Kitasatospora sp. NPDC051170]|uniref:hypothetical protein n=1 Tax=Kitasatospora sp. NPDC051170 TaxID=3364056 RepID=UPI0037B7FB5C
MELTNWRCPGGGGGTLVLAVNFDAGRGDAGFSDLAACLAGHTVWETAPLPATGDLLPESEPGAYVRPWLDEVQRHGRPVGAVLGMCAAAPLAQLLARGVREAGLGSPPVLLYDPLPVDRDTLVTEFELALTPLRGRMTPAELAEFGPPAASPAAPPGADLAAADLVPDATELLRTYTRAVHTVCGRLGVAENLRTQLADRFTRYLTYLAAASRADRPSGPRLLLSRDHTAPWPGEPAQTTRFEVSGAELLADPEVAAFTERALHR